ERLVQPRETRGLAHDQDVVVAERRAEVLEPRGVVLHAAVAGQLLEHRRRAHVQQNRAVPGRGVRQVVRRHQPAGAWPVLDDDVRIARYVLPQVAGDDTGIGVISAARVVADDQVQGLAAEEVRYRAVAATRLRGGLAGRRAVARAPARSGAGPAA